MAKKTKTKKSTLDTASQRKKISIHGKALRAVIDSEAITSMVQEARKRFEDICTAQGRLSRDLSDLLSLFSQGGRVGDDANAPKSGDRDSDRNPPIPGTRSDNDPSHAGAGRSSLPGAKDLARGKSDRASVDRSESARRVALGIELPPGFKEYIPPISELRDHLFEKCHDIYTWDGKYFELIAAHHAVSATNLAQLVAGIEFKWEKRAYPPHRQDGQWKPVYEFRPKK